MNRTTIYFNGCGEPFSYDPQGSKEVHEDVFEGASILKGQFCPEDEWQDFVF